MCRFRITSKVTFVTSNTDYACFNLQGQLKEHDGAGDDFDKISVDEALRRLECTKAGLTDADVQSRLQKFGPNKIPEDKKNPYWEYAVCAIFSSLGSGMLNAMLPSSIDYLAFIQ